MLKKTIYIVLVLCLVFILSDNLQAQCAMCGASVQSSEEGNEMVAGLNAGILYLLAIPYILFMTFAFFIYRSIKRKKQQERHIFNEN